MALQVTNLQRTFTYKKDGKEIVLADPNVDLTAAEVMKFYSGVHPELTNGIIEGPIVVADKATYRFTTQAGKLG